MQPEDKVRHRRSTRGRVEGVFACCRAVKHPFASSAADCSPEPIPDRGAELNLFLPVPLAVPGELLQHTKESQRPAPPRISPCSRQPFHARLQTCRTAPTLCRLVLSIEDRSVLQGLSAWGGGAPAARSIYRIRAVFLLPTTCSLPQCLAGPGPSTCPHSMPLCNWITGTVCSRVQQTTTTASAAQQTLTHPDLEGMQDPRTVQHLSCTRVSQARLRQRPQQLTTTHTRDSCACRDRQNAAAILRHFPLSQPVACSEPLITIIFPISPLSE